MRVSQIFITVDALVFRKLSTITELLLIKRKNDPFRGSWAIPGGFVDEHEDIEDAAKRELREETGIHIEKLEQVHAFGKPHRDPRSHTISIAFMGRVEPDAVATAADDADEAQWFPIDNLPNLAFDHAEIISFTLQKFNI